VGRVYLSKDVNEYLQRVESLSGVQAKVIIDQACDYATPYLAGYNVTAALPPKGTARRSASSKALITLHEYAVATGTTVGQVADYLLRQFLPVMVYDPNIRKQAYKGRVIVQVHPMVLTMFHQVKAADETGNYMKVQDYLWYLTKELPDDILLRLIDESAATWASYRGGGGIPYTSMSCPRRIYTMVSAGSLIYRAPKAALYSSFIISLLRWYKRLEDTTDNLLRFPEPDAHELPWNEDALAQLWRYVFDLGLTAKGEQ
jgi:hypothetical protein